MVTRLSSPPSPERLSTRSMAVDGNRTRRRKGPRTHRRANGVEVWRWHLFACISVAYVKSFVLVRGLGSPFLCGRLCRFFGMLMFACYVRRRPPVLYVDARLCCMSMPACAVRRHLHAMLVDVRLQCSSMLACTVCRRAPAHRCRSPHPPTSTHLRTLTHCAVLSTTTSVDTIADFCWPVLGTGTISSMM